MQNPTSIMYDNASGHAVAVAAATPLPVVGGTGASSEQVQGPAASGAAKVGNPVLVGGEYNTSLPTLDNGDAGSLQVDVNGNLRTLAMITATAGADGVSNGGIGWFRSAGAVATNLLAFVAGAIFNGTSWDRLVKANAVSRIPASAATNNATSAKGSAGNLHTVVAYNSNAAVRYLKFYNKATAPNPASDTPVLTIALPPTSQVDVTIPNSLYFSTGIGYALVTGSGDTDNTAVVANDILGLNVIYS